MRCQRNRMRFARGHWDGDLILDLGSSAIGTLVERITRFTMLLHLPPMPGHGEEPREKNGPALAGHGAEAVRDAMAREITTLLEQLRRSLTWDQGAEMAQHARLRIDTGVAVYFCDPRSPLQRGTNENTNGLLRQYFPKGTHLGAHGADDLKAVAATLNGRPRKTLGWTTPVVGRHLPRPSTSCCNQFRLMSQRPVEPGQFCAHAYHRVLDEHGMRCSMSRKGNCRDNAPMESFFGGLKAELAGDGPFDTRQAARTALFQAIEGWHNRQRLHSGIGYITPTNKEELATAA